MTVINFPGSNGNNGRQSLVSRAVGLKQRLVSFALSGPLREELERINHGVSLEQPFSSAAIDLIDWFLFEWEGPDGTQVLDEFLEQAADLDDEDRRVLEGWYEPIDDIFEVVSRGAGGFRFRDEEGNEYAVVPTRMRIDELPWTEGTFVSTRILPVGDIYILSGIQSFGSSRERLEDEALGQLDAQIDEMIRVVWGVLTDAFREHFGSDEVDVPVGELETKIDAFRDFAFERFVLDGGRTLGEVLRETFGELPPLATIQRSDGVPASARDVPDVTLIADPEDGIAAAPGYSSLRRFVSRGEGDPEDLRLIVLDLLESESIPAFVFRRLAAIDAARLGVLLAFALDDPDFEMAADFEGMLEEYKPELVEDDDDLDDDVFDEGDFDGLEDFAFAFGDYVTPDDIIDVRDLPDSECAPGTLIEASVAFLEESHRVLKSAAFEKRVAGVNLLFHFLDEAGVDLVDEIAGEELVQFATVWYTASWSERGSEDVKALLVTLEKFGEWLERERGWRRGDAFLETLGALRRELPRTVAATEIYDDLHSSDEDEDPYDFETARAEPEIEGLFVIQSIDGESVSGELVRGHRDGLEAEPGLEVTMQVPPEVATRLKKGDYFFGKIGFVDATWAIRFVAAFVPAAAVE